MSEDRDVVITNQILSRIKAAGNVTEKRRAGGEARLDEEQRQTQDDSNDEHDHDLESTKDVFVEVLDCIELTIFNVNATPIHSSGERLLREVVKRDRERTGFH